LLNCSKCNAPIIEPQENAAKLASVPRRFTWATGCSWWRWRHGSTCTAEGQVAGTTTWHRQLSVTSQSATYTSLIPRNQIPLWSTCIQDTS